MKRTTKMGRKITMMISAIALAMMMPAAVFGEAVLDDAVSTANKSVSAPAALVMFIALLVMCFVGKKFYKK